MATAETIGMSIGIAVLSVLLVIVLAYVWLVRQRISKFAEIAARDTLTALGSLSGSGQKGTDTSTHGARRESRSVLDGIGVPRRYQHAM